MSLIQARVHEQIAFSNQADFTRLLQRYLVADQIQPGHQNGTAEVSERPRVVRFPGCLVVTAAYRNLAVGGIDRSDLHRLHHLHASLRAELYEPDELARVGFWSQTDPAAVVTLTALGGGIQEVRFFESEWQRCDQIPLFFQRLREEHGDDANIIVLEAAAAKEMLELGITPKSLQCFLVQIDAHRVSVVDNFMPTFVPK
ncbi:MAG: hypothetical protein H6760_02635 [Candidatus Nomurabacteria bacterium]|nr:MAG: hypothetical protein H6760_02635 [Candidatus Nomurabacteria bacterium]